MRKWRIEDSEELYNINGWGVNYFGINEKGHVYVTPRKDSVKVDLRELMDELAIRDMSAPVLVRFWTTVSRKPAIASRRLPRNMTTKERISSFIPLRSTKYVPW